MNNLIEADIYPRPPKKIVTSILIRFEICSNKSFLNSSR